MGSRLTSRSSGYGNTQQQRSEDYSQVNIVARKRTDAATLAEFTTDESGIFHAQKIEAVYYPQSEAELADLLAQSNKSQDLVTVSGAGTGLSGGRVPLHGGVVIATEDLAAAGSRELTRTDADQLGKQYTIYVDEKRQEAYVPAGVSTELLDEMLPEGLLYPPDPTEKSGFLGANIACNASGARTFHYGATRNWVLGLRLVLPTGDILSVNRGEVTAADDRLRFTSESGAEYTVPVPTYQMPHLKNAAGLYAGPGMDLLDLFIGSDGILGVITEAHLKLTARPDNIVGEIAFFNSETDALSFVEDMRGASQRGDMAVLSIEYFDANSLDFIEHEALTGKDFGAAAYIEVAGALDELDPLMEALDANHCAEDWFAETDQDRREQKDFRHSLPDEVHSYLRRRDSQAWVTDFVVPAHKFPEMLQAYHTAGATFRGKFPREGKYYLVFGHIGDYHLHVEFMSHNPDELSFVKQLYADLAKQAIAFGGTISGEHGVGKKMITVDGHIMPYLELMYSREGVMQIARAKQALDPNLILNVGNMVPREYLEELEE